MKQIYAIALLLWNMVGLVMTKLGSVFRRTTSEKEKFLQYYEPDRLWAMDQDMAQERYSFSGCIACGLCESLLVQIPPASHLRRIPPLPQELVWGAGRDLPSLHHLQEILHTYQDHLRTLESLCPARIPFHKLLAVLRLYEQNQQTQNHPPLES